MSVTSAYVMDGNRHVVETHTDNLGKKYTQTFFAAGELTTQQITNLVNAHGQELAVRLADAEVDQVIG